MGFGSGFCIRIEAISEEIHFPGGAELESTVLGVRSRRASGDPPQGGWAIKEGGVKLGELRSLKPKPGVKKNQHQNILHDPWKRPEKAREQPQAGCEP